MGDHQVPAARLGAFLKAGRAADVRLRLDADAEQPRTFRHHPSHCVESALVFEAIGLYPLDIACHSGLHNANNLHASTIGDFITHVLFRTRG